MEMLGVAVGLIIGWYFTSKRGETPIKIPRATEKHPDFPKIRSQLVKALEETGTYNPAYDDIMVNEIAKTIIDIRKVDEAVDKAEDLGMLQQAVKLKAVLVGMLENCVESLAMTRRVRLKVGSPETFKNTLYSRLKALLEGGS